MDQAAVATEIDWLTVLGVASFVTGTILSVFSIWLSAYFYTKSKSTETSVQTSLAEIKQQTDALQRLSGRMLDRLTRAVTEGRPDHEHRQMVLLVEAMRIFQPGNAVPTNPPGAAGPSRTELIQIWACAYLYASISNVSCQALLPDGIADVSAELRRLVDMTSIDVATLENWLGAPDENWNPMARDLFDYTGASWRPHVRDTLGFYQNRQQADATA
jgi:hypothetical protein